MNVQTHTHGYKLFWFWLETNHNYAKLPSTTQYGLIVFFNMLAMCRLAKQVRKLNLLRRRENSSNHLCDGIQAFLIFIRYALTVTPAWTITIIIMAMLTGTHITEKSNIFHASEMCILFILVNAAALKNVCVPNTPFVFIKLLLKKVVSLMELKHFVSEVIPSLINVIHINAWISIANKNVCYYSWNQFFYSRIHIHMKSWLNLLQHIHMHICSTNITGISINWCSNLKFMLIIIIIMFYIIKPDRKITTNKIVFQSSKSRKTWSLYIKMKILEAGYIYVYL